ncbi:MAG: hypothetical protein GX960_12495, partial [Actinomycetales bacterium]|nr:hypothetical protein [Actinomycetales bacterium]
ALIGFAGLLPLTWESTEPAYVALNVLANLLVVAAGFFPTWTAAIGAGLLVSFAALFPESVNPFVTVGEVAAAVFVSRLQLARFGAVSLLLFATYFLTASWGAQSFQIVELTTVIFGWALAALLGAAAALLEVYIRREIRRREDNARESERELARIRHRFAIDAHDTVSHGLSVESAIIRVLSNTSEDPVKLRELLAELALVNANTQYKLRTLLAQMTAPADSVRTSVALDSELREALASIHAVAEASGFDLEVEVESLPRRAAVDEFDSVLLALQELTTNIVKHSSSAHGCALQLEMVRSHGREHLRICASNPVSAPTERTVPRSLAARVAQLGGSCVIIAEHPLRFTVEVMLPVSSKIPRTREADDADSPVDWEHENSDDLGAVPGDSEPDSGDDHAA